ncbi:TrbG/VirB9 family P-type conjugative transfer protein [Acidithiobacillus sp. YTS05]|nr:TrbG/VirB9 family P-type conjugative transfer protein [Acidithiobacillus sp. YTS05]
MRQSILCAAVAASLLSCSGLAVAHVVTTSPAPDGISGQVPAIHQSIQTVDQPNVTTNGVSAESSAEIWQQAIKAPPEGKISARSKKAMEAALVAAYEAGKTQNLPPIAGTNGEVLYAFGQSLPTLVTAPLHTSLILLQRGMKNPQGQGLTPGYWQLKTLMAGDQPELAVTPRFAGLHGNLVITGSSRSGKPMIYVVEVTSDARRYTPMIGFYYPGSIEYSWKQDQQASAAKAKQVATETVATLPSINATDLDFSWKMRCAGGGWFSSSDCRSILPERVFDDGKQTFIQFKPGQGSHGGIPSILAENVAGQPAIINTTFRDGYYIVDGVPQKILLLAGKGSSGKVVKLIHERP